LNQTPSNTTSPASDDNAAPGFSSMSIGWSRYSKIRSKSASDVCTSTPTDSIEPTGRTAGSAAS
jgi:hypothetical protein